MKLQAKFPSFCHLLSSVLAFAVLFSQSGASFPAFAAEAAPAAIQISSGEELARIGKDAGYPMDGDYELTGDITLEGNWIPLGGIYGGKALATLRTPMYFRAPSMGKGMWFMGWLLPGPWQGK